MRKSLRFVVAFAAFAIVAGLALPGMAESPAYAGAASATTDPVLDLSVVPIKPVTGRLRVRGVDGDDESDDDLTLRQRHSNSNQASVPVGEDDGAPGEDSE